MGSFVPFSFMIGISMTLGCVKSAATPCGDIVCPIGRVCAEDNHCVDENIAITCAESGDGDACSVPEIGDGICRDHLCIVGTCGDGIINAIDACDGTNLNGRSCLDYGATDPNGLACGTDCSFDTTACTAYCGDGIKGELEECDGADAGNKSCIDFGYYTGTLVCTEDCKINIGQCSGQCGDGTVDAFETCDGSNFNGQTCTMAGYMGDVLPMTCSSACAIAPSSCTCGGELCQPNTQKCVLTGGIYSCEPV